MERVAKAESLQEIIEEMREGDAIQTISECATSKENVAPGHHPGEGGVNPTVALQSVI